MQRIQKVGPLRRVRDIGIVDDQHIIEMKWMIEGGAKQQHARQNQASRDFHGTRVVDKLHVDCAIFGPTII